MTAPPAPPPVVLPARYVVERELGRGGMATVYLARDVQHDVPVAVKVVRDDFLTAAAGARFAREVRITARLQHPHILPVLDSGAVDGRPYYTMPYVEGESLATRLTRERQLPVGDALRIASQVAGALAYAHARGFVHRDLKPGNILLAHGGVGGTGPGAGWHALLADFGIARAVEATGGTPTGTGSAAPASGASGASTPATAGTRPAHTPAASTPVAGAPLTEAGVVVGTVQYMSPEQAMGERADARSDIYGLACVLYEMLAGAPPFTGPTARAVLARQVVDPVPSVRTVRPAVSAALEGILATALAKVPADRYADADAFKAALDAEAIAVAAGPRTGEETQPVRGVGTPRRAGTRRGLIAGGGLAAVVVAGALLWRTVTPPPVLDANRVVVYPLLVTVPGAPASMGEDVATTVRSAIGDGGTVRVVDGWGLLPPGRRDDGRELRNAEAARLTRDQRARYALTGRVVPRGDAVLVELTLRDVAGDSTVARGEAVGRAADAWRLGPRAATALLPALVGGSAPGAAARLADWDDRDPGAVASFLLGEASFRRLRRAEALTHYRDAVRRDSAFGMAALRGAQAASWLERSDEAGTLVDVALRHPLSPRDAYFARGYRAYLDGRADSASAEFRRAVRLDPEMAVAWLQLGETYTHLLPAAGPPARSADSAFSEAHRLDPAAGNVAFHLAEVRLRQGRLAEAAPLVAQVLAADDTLMADELRVMDACVRRGPARVDWAAAVRARPTAVFTAAKSLAVGLAQPRCAEAAYAAVITHDTVSTRESALSERLTALFGLAPLLMARGATADASAAIDASVARGDGGATFFVLAAPLYPAVAARGAARVAADRAQYGPAYRGATDAERLTTLGRWEAQAGHPDTALMVARHLDALARATPRAADPADPALGPAVAAWAALARGDTASAVAGFTAAVAAPMASGAGIAWGTAEPRGAERLTLARLLVARQQYRRALDVADVFDAPAAQAFTLYLPASLEVRAAAAAALGETGGRYQERLAALRGGRAPAVPGAAPR